ncbi:MAG: S4 domain-containing protein [Candidatus Delongbacteria bacterium]|jgi:ribosome-associated heat shock protein Hsp15|nr:S4 domain-containing protein [Candidatus Delongbacteria bacterium]
MAKETRIDKFLWCVRLFKTRSKATTACKKKHILVNDQDVKPSSKISTGDKIEIKRPPIIRSFYVIEILNSRVGAKLVEDYIKETTPEEEFKKLKKARETGIIRTKGKGRPTKKERRQLDKINPYK